MFVRRIPNRRVCGCPNVHSDSNLDDKARVKKIQKQKQRKEFEVDVKFKDQPEKLIKDSSGFKLVIMSTRREEEEKCLDPK